MAVSGVLVNRLLEIYYGFEFNKNNDINKIDNSKKEVLVIGYGWGGKAFCDNINKDKYNVTIVSKTDKMLNTIKLKKSIFENDKDLFLDKTDNLNFVVDECNYINKFKKYISTKTKNYSYDYLVLAVGSEINDFGIYGVKDNCHFLKSMDDLEKLRNSLKNNDSNKKIVIMGAGPAGIELAFQLSKHFKDIKIVEAMPTILPMFNESTIELVKKELEKSNIQLLLNNKVNQVKPNVIKIIENNADKTIDYDFSIWNCGIKPPSLLKMLTSGKFTVDKNLRFGNDIFAIGDIVASKELGPPTGQNAKKQGIYLANYFNNDFKGEDYKYIEDGKILRTKDNLILESSYGSFRVPNIFEWVIDKIILR